MPFGRKPKEFPDHLWTKCPTCGEMLFNKQLVRNLNVCSKCEHHFRLGARPRIEQLVDKGSFVEQDSSLVSGDPLRFVDSKPYPERIAAAQAKSGEKDAAIAGTAAIGGNPVELVVMDFEFMGGSMGSVVGEKITRAAERALAERRALVIVSASGGARMQEGTIALMQMGKIVSALARLDEAGIPYVSVITDPTTGGVLASYASLGDLIVAEPGALIRFSGERVTSGTVGEKLPVGFGRSEFLLEKGFLDQIVSRAQLKERIAFFLWSFRAASQDVRWGL
ncbi:MAG: acetyl-CoA carboxylase carboxyltransferase subunit beta [Chloroflexi bacterium]|nr:MAG: acetyl-CoA carboxylase carboxyltransferase subunit beta [Chloroflexota bacterium]TMB94919.1 MAG: acetyl-CoA carboxylase carboxyltransferase subunit beta [Chloroflexota bacterium]TMC54596.1 MAG: acetyl-CoA carboxylase carboxyltransferase subunit beta [Chloroflexota bacterium]